MTVGGTGDELGLMLLGLECLAEKLEVTGRRRPPLLDDVRRDLAAVLKAPERSVWADGPLGGEDAGVMTPALLTYHEAAERLRVAEVTVRRLVARGDLPAVALGRARRIRPTDLHAFIEALHTTKEG